MFWISVKKSLSNIVVKDIKGMLLFRPRLLKSSKACNRKPFKDRKTYFNITAIFKAYALIIKTEGIRSYIVGLITHF